jgi:hypothetical protein
MYFWNHSVSGCVDLDKGTEILRMLDGTGLKISVALFVCTCRLGVPAGSVMTLQKRLASRLRERHRS